MVAGLACPAGGSTYSFSHSNILLVSQLLESNEVSHHRHLIAGEDLDCRHQEGQRVNQVGSHHALALVVDDPEETQITSYPSYPNTMSRNAGSSKKRETSSFS